MTNYDCKVCGEGITNDERSPQERNSDILDHFSQSHSNDARVNMASAFRNYLEIQE